MEKHRMWMIGGSLLIVAVLVLGFLLGVQPQLAAMATANSERASVEAANTAAEIKLGELKAQFDKLDELKAELAPLLASVPTGSDDDKLVDQIDALAKAAGVTLSGITVAEAQAYTPVLPSVVPVEVVEGEDPAVAAEAAALAAEAAAANPAAGEPPVSSPLVTAENFAVLGVSVEVQGSHQQVFAFVNGLQTGSRLFLVTGINTTLPLADSNGVLEAQIDGLVFAALSPDQVAAQ